jgi:hypothetical protein
VNFESEIICLNHLIYINGPEFTDPRSKGATLESTLLKVTDLYSLALTLDSELVHRAVAQGLMHILESCIKPKYGLDLEKTTELLLQPLLKIMNKGEDNIAQKGAIHCFYFLVRACFENNYSELLNSMYTYLLTLFKGHYVEDHEYID